MLYTNDIEVGRQDWTPPPPSHPKFWELLEDPGAASQPSSVPSKT